MHIKYAPASPRSVQPPPKGQSSRKYGESTLSCIAVVLEVKKELRKLQKRFSRDVIAGEFMRFAAEVVAITNQTVNGRQVRTNFDTSSPNVTSMRVATSSTGRQIRKFILPLQRIKLSRPDWTSRFERSFGSGRRRLHGLMSLIESNAEAGATGARCRLAAVVAATNEMSTTLWYVRKLWWPTYR